MDPAVTELSTLDETLRALHYADAPGLQRADGAEPKDSRGFVWREMRHKCGVDSAYFRGGVPLVAFGESETRDGISKLRQRLWNLNRVPILIAQTPKEIIAHSCFESPSSDGATSHRALLARPASDASELVKQFARFEVERGEVTRRYRHRFRKSDRVDRRLLTNLQLLRRQFKADREEMEILDTIIGRVIFIRYLEDREIIPVDRLRAATDQERLIDVLKSGSAATYELFRLLASTFNGDIFNVSESESNKVNDVNLTAISQFLAGDDLDSGQQSLWPYDFSIIPPDLISSVYEKLLESTQRRDAAYYTPRRVVDLILDETLPLVEPSPEDFSTATPRILDPACGSGIFLTEAFRRLIFRHSNAAGERLEFDHLANLLTKTIFGVDKSPIAIDVATLGLYLALLEEIDSESVWNRARLPLIAGRNLIVSDFLARHPLSAETFDIIVGNPPWDSELSEAAEQYVADHSITVPDKQIAMVFLHAAVKNTAPNGQIGLLMPSKSLLHNRSGSARAARRVVFDDFGVETVIDLATMRREIFHSATAPATVLIARPHTDTSNTSPRILHVAPRPSPLQSSIDGFSVSHSDVHLVAADLATDSTEIWKTLLWGSMADHAFLTRLRQTFGTLRDLASENGWTWGRGIQVAGKDKLDASDLLGMRYLETTAIESFHLDMTKTTQVETQVMHRSCNRQLFQGPHVLIRRGLVGGLPAAAFCSEDLVHSVLGISGPQRDANRLRLVTAYINSSMSIYYHFLTSSSWGVERSVVEVSEHLSLPVPDLSEDVAREAIERLKSVTDPATRHLTADWRQQLDDVVFDVYQLTDSERNRVRDTVAFSLSQFTLGEDSPAALRPTQEQLKRYVNSLREILLTAITSTRIAVETSEPIASYVVVTVSFTDQAHSPLHDTRLHLSDNTPRHYPLDRLVSDVDLKSSQWPSPATLVQPSAIVLQDADVHVIKLCEARYWTTTQAYEDAGNLLGAIFASHDHDDAT